jgi:glyoxylase-like metal-dependent hydrolase (beta-lactamase superfamily II)
MASASPEDTMLKHIPFTLGALLFVPLLAAGGQATPAPPDPLIKAGTTVQLSPHVHAIPDASVPLVPNVGIVVGDRATLVIDSGLGTRNGQIVLAEVAKVSRNADLYVISTHQHPEHALGEGAFPPTAKLIRARAAQQDVDELGLGLAETFSRRSAMTAELLKGAQYRKADILFDREHSLDLGGVRVRMLALGPTHTRGDVAIFVEGDRVLFAGDIVMNRTFLAFASPASSVRAGLAALDRLSALAPQRIVPSHGGIGDASLIDLDRAYLATLQNRVRELKAQGQSADQAVQAVTRELQSKYPDWTNGARLEPAVRSAFNEAP